MAKVFWFTGLSGAGKTTLAQIAQEHLSVRSLPCVLLDGDEIRTFFEGDLGYSREERILNVRRVAFGAYLLAQNDIHVIVANIAPYYEVRDFIRRKLRNSYIQIYVRASLECVQRRDVKGLYKGHKQGEESQLVGLDDQYDIPRSPDLILDTENTPLSDSQGELIKFLDSIITNMR